MKREREKLKPLQENSNQNYHSNNSKNSSQGNRNWLFIKTFLIVILGVFFDQYTKHLAVLHLKESEPLVILDGVFELYYLENRGAAFGILEGKQTFFILSVVIITVLILWFLKIVPLEKRFMPLSLIAAFILAGAYGNCIDRAVLGYVVDFFYFKLIDFPVFNVADIYVTVSTFLMVFLLFFYYKEEELERIIHNK